MTIARKQKANQVQESQLDLHKALSHRLRMEILTLLTERMKASPVEMSRELKAPVGDVSHHVKQLVKYGCAEEVETRPRRGAVEHFYRATARPTIWAEDLEKMGALARQLFSGHIIQMVLGDLEEGIGGDTIDGDVDSQLTRVPMSLDAEGRRELLALHERTLEETYEVQARSDARRGKSGEEAVRISSCQLCFELPPK
jgi:helix-turn-helix protein